MYLLVKNCFRYTVVDTNIVKLMSELKINFEGDSINLAKFCNGAITERFLYDLESIVVRYVLIVFNVYCIVVLHDYRCMLDQAWVWDIILLIVLMLEVVGRYWMIRL